MPISVYTHKNATSFINKATPFWRRDPVYNNLQWALALDNAKNPGFIGAILSIGSDTWVGVQTNDARALILNGPDELPAPTIASFKEVFKVAKGLISSKVLCDRVVEAWGCKAIEPMPMYLYRLDELDPALNFRGTLQSWPNRERHLLAVWLEAFADAINEAIVGRDFMERAEEMIDLGHIWLLRVNGEIVSMAGSTRSIGGVACVNYVFTPENLRGNGYAYSCVGLLSAQLLQTHNSCCLYAEEAYLASNRVYQKLGYRVVGRTKEVTFNTNH